MWGVGGGYVPLQVILHEEIYSVLTGTLFNRLMGPYMGPSFQKIDSRKLLMGTSKAVSSVQRATGTKYEN